MSDAGETTTFSNSAHVLYPGTNGGLFNCSKTHLLIHSVESFRSLRWYETERNEQFNPSIRGALIKSNRKGSLKHVCSFFGQIEYLQLISMGYS